MKMILNIGSVEILWMSLSDEVLAAPPNSPCHERS